MGPIIAGWSRDRIFNPAWIDDLSRVPNAGMTATIEIFDRGMGDAEYDIKLGEYVYPEAEKIIYSGMARVQQIRMARNVPNNASDTLVQAVRFQIPKNSATLKTDYRVRVTECDLNPHLLTYEFVIQGIINSSNPIEQTFETQADTRISNGDD